MDCPAYSSETSFTMASAHRQLRGGYKSDPALDCLEAPSLCRANSQEPCRQLSPGLSDKP